MTKKLWAAVAATALCGAGALAQGNSARAERFDPGALKVGERPVVLVLKPSAVRLDDRGQALLRVDALDKTYMLGAGTSMFILEAGKASAPCEAADDSLSGAVVMLFAAVSGVPDLRCTATLVRPDRLLTAAHCVDPEFQQAIDFTATTQYQVLQCASPAAYRRVPPDVRSGGCRSDTEGCDHDLAVCSRSDGKPFSGQSLAVGSAGFEANQTASYLGFGLRNRVGTACRRQTLIGLPANWKDDRIPYHFAEHMALTDRPRMRRHDSGGPVLAAGAAGRLEVSAVLARKQEGKYDGLSIEIKPAAPAVQAFLDCSLKGPGPLPADCP